jgi:hypothetical protein
MRQVKVTLMCVQNMPRNPKNSGTTETKCPSIKDEVMVIQRKQPGTHKKGRGLHAWRRMTDGK